MPSKKVFDSLLAKGFRVDLCPYATYDSPANQDDFEALFSVLSEVRDSNGRPAVITANTIMTNPNFKKIEESGFREYCYEMITDTFQRNFYHFNPLEYYLQGLEENIFFPQYHGREHINIKEWMKQLRDTDSAYRQVFKEGVSWLGSKYNPPGGINLRATYDTYDAEDINSQKSELKEGLELFRNIFKLKSESFIAPNFILHPDLYSTLHENGVHYIQGMKYLIMPKLAAKKRGMQKRIQGQKNRFGQVDLVRNCEFEPSQYPQTYDSVGECMKEIENAFFWKKPAVISAHRLNFIGNIQPENRARNLKKFKELLNRITNTWPDIEFMTSVELGKLMSGR